MSAPKSHLTPAEVFGQRVREIRELRHLTQAELAERVHVDRTTLNKIEAGTRSDVSISQLFAFANALEVAPVHLLSPRLEDRPLRVGKTTLAPREARAWIRGALPPGTGPSGPWFLSLPRDEQREILERASAEDRAKLALLLVGDESVELQTLQIGVDAWVARERKAGGAPRKSRQRQKEGNDDG